jgi:hypothetical protein
LRVVCLRALLHRRQQMADAEAETRAMATNIDLDGEAVQWAGMAVHGDWRLDRHSAGSTRNLWGGARGSGSSTES